MSQATDFLEVEQRKGMFRTTTAAVRANTTVYAAGALIWLTSFDGGFYECVTGGTSAGSPPAFNTTLGQTTTDGSVTWQRVLLGMPKRPMEVALYTAAPGETGGGTEATGGSYAAVAADPGDSVWTGASATNGLTDNAGVLTYPVPSGNWGLLLAWGLRIRNTTNLAIYNTLTASKNVNNGDPAPSFAIGALTVTFA